MKTVIFCVVFFSFLLFTDTETYRAREVLIEQREKAIETGIVVFDSLYTEGLRLEQEIDSIGVEVKKKAIEVKKLNIRQ